MVQKHAASRLHFDFRLELDGVLKSWAVTRGPSLDPNDKRLAVRTEDHPLDYAGFEGSIPRSEYGGGTVMIWDKGIWHPVPGKTPDDLEKGHLHFVLEGKRMKGEWLLVRMKPRKGEKRENWLLRKVDDDFAGGADELVRRELTSVETGRTMQEIGSGAHDDAARQNRKTTSLERRMKAAKPAGATNGAARGPVPGRRSDQNARRSCQGLPAFRKPQLATLADHVPDGPDWLHEIKFDGYRLLVAADGNKVAMYTRSGQDWTAKFRPLGRAIAALDLPSCLIDGEVTAPDKGGNPSFSALQAALKRGNGAQTEADRLEFHAFDLLEAYGKDLASYGNLERKARLAELLAHATPPVRLTDHVIGAGERLFGAMCDAGQEGIISKRANGLYRGHRTRDWLKIKCTRRQEFVIVGWQPSKARGRPFASLLMAQHENGKPIYKGKVGTGFDYGTMAELAGMFEVRSRKTPPLDAPKAETCHARWIRADLVAEVAFSEFTSEGRLRHASFLGLRRDKAPWEVVPEAAVSLEDGGASEADGGLKQVGLTHGERVVFPDSGQTKRDLAQYYSTIASLILPQMARRPVSLVRCPQGRARKCFFQKHDNRGLGEHVHKLEIHEKSGKSQPYLYIDDAEGLLECIQMGTIEFHAWSCHCDFVDRPDRMIFDLDPDEDLEFKEVTRAANDIQEQLAHMGLISFAMLTGGKGIHVLVPLRRGHEWNVHTDFARRFAQALSGAEPQRFTATMAKAKREGKIFIDWYRNQRGATAVVPYFARARTGAPIAAPVTWSELRNMKSAAAFSIDDASTLLERSTGDELAGWGVADQGLPDL